MSDYIKRLEEMADWLSTDALHYEVSRKAAVRLSADLRSLLSDVGRMREALEHLANPSKDHWCEPDPGETINDYRTGYRECLHDVASAARQALSVGGGKGEASVAESGSALHGRATDGSVKLEGCE